jgi:hypothetical protein
MSDDIGGYIGYVKRGFTTDNLNILNNLSSENGAEISGNLSVSGECFLQNVNINGDLIISGTLQGGSSSVWEANGINIYNKNSGNVGIGLDNPSYNLDVSGDIHCSNQLYIGTPSSSNIINMGDGATGSSDYGNSIIETRTYSGNKTEMLIFKGRHAVPTDGPDRVRIRAGAIAFDTYSSDLSNPATIVQRQIENIRMYIDNSGNVGIGTTTPNYKLDISGDLFINNGNLIVNNIGQADTQISILNTSTGGRQYVLGSSSSSSASGAGNFYILDASAGNLTRFFIKSDGNVGIGTTNPGYPLEVVGNAAKTDGTTTWSTVSDIRIKEDIEDADLLMCYNNIKNLPLRRFKWTDGNNMGNDKHVLGYIAQEVKSFFPKSVEIKEKTIIKDGKEELIDDFHYLNEDQIIKSMNGAMKYLINMKEDMEKNIHNLEEQLKELQNVNNNF